MSEYYFDVLERVESEGELKQRRKNFALDKLEALKTDGDGNQFLADDGQYKPVSGGGGIDYSTTEQWTGLRWIDGKKIYQKTVVQGKLAGINQALTTPHHIQNMAECIGYTSHRVYANDSPFAPSLCFPADCTGGGPTDTIRTTSSLDSQNIYQLGNHADFIQGNYKYYTTLRYTCTNR